MSYCRKFGNRAWALVVAAAGLAVSGSAFGVGIETIYTKYAGSPTSAIPGPVDLNGAPATSDWKAIESMVISPGGGHWLVKGRTNLGSDLEHIVVIGSGRTGTMLVQEGQFAPGGGADERYENFGGGQSSAPAPIGRFDGTGKFAFSSEVRVGATGQTYPANGERIFVWNGSTFSVAVAQNDPYTGVFDTPTAPGGGSPGDETAGSALSAVHLLNNGTVGFNDATIAHTGFTLAIGNFYNHALFHQGGGTDTVIGLGGVGTPTFAASTGVPKDRFVTTPDGQHWMMVGTIAGSPSRNVLVRDGTVIVQAAQPPVAGVANVGTISNFALLPNGHWFAWGTYQAQGGFWALKDGALAARTGDPITTGSTETWGSTVYMLTGNQRGDWAIQGTTSAAAAANEVLVAHAAGTESVLAREGDMVDINNDGVDNDNAFLGSGGGSGPTFINTTMGMSDDGWLYFFADIHDSSGADLNSPSFFGDPTAFVRVHFTPTSTCGSADFNGDGDLGTDSDIAAFFSCLAGDCCATCGSADFNGDGDLGTDSDIESFFRVLAGGPC
jgi:hypothetical protein